MERCKTCGKPSESKYCDAGCEKLQIGYVYDGPRHIDQAHRAEWWNDPALKMLITAHGFTQ